ncbi:hypothetical protein NQ317_016736 [Molorchus minor]|uniref:Uncharacterized protein n=1 Tax=Molorchus minor TaxID=1323400 RepID=A0ABQ9J9E8_9CUCU|nr:hypothetical protein NQ317_016736 [Molorchus minor]
MVLEKDQDTLSAKFSSSRKRYSQLKLPMGRCRWNFPVASLYLAVIMSESAFFDIDKRAGEVSEELLPRKMKKTQYEAFQKWCRVQNVQKPTENALLVYFDEKSRVVCSLTLWAHYSMLKSVFNIRENVDISKFPKLLAFLKRKNEGFKPKKSNVLTIEQVDQFLQEAPNDKYLVMKVL